MQGLHNPNRELLDAEALCRQLVDEGSVYAFLADHRTEVFPDDMFEDLFPSSRGRPSIPAGVMASAMILKELEGLSDRQAAEALRCDIRWKVACGLALDDEGVHYTVFTYWRQRLGKSQSPNRIGDAVRQVVDATGVLSGKKRRALDSTLVDDAVATQDTVTQLVSQIRRVRRLVPRAKMVDVTAHDYDASGKPVCAWDDPDAKAALVSGLVNDAVAILDAVDDIRLDDKAADAVGLLALVAGQDVEPGDGEGTWRIVDGTAKDRVISTVDPDARHMHKSVSQYRDGYKAHIAVEPETGIITASTLTAANIGDGPIGVDLLDGEGPGLQVLADSAYGSGEVRAALKDGEHTVVIKPIPLKRNHRLGDDQFTRDDFIVDYDNETVTCPNNVTVPVAASGAATFGAKCRGCPLRQRCTSATDGRTFRVGDFDQLLAQARAQWQAQHGTDDYRQYRPMVERSISWIVTNGHRRVRYRGVEANRAQLALRVAAINLRRLVSLGLNHNGHGWAVT
ncbi:MAG: IS1182 family transposase [Armatimonadetes bacterium]|nr:MAG: IS1182 family transposase [Armatimonadota bacterium]